MNEPSFYLTVAGTALAALAMLVAAGLHGWRGWLALKHQQLALAGGGQQQAPVGLPSATARIEIADLKERIRRLEAIAAGVEL